MFRAFLLAAGFTALVSAADPGPFEGKWVLDKKEAGDVPGHLAQEIRREGGNIVVKSKFDQPKNGVYPIAWLGIMTEQLRLNPNGRQTTESVGPYQLASKTTIFGNSMITDWTAVNKPGSVKGQWVRTVQDDGKHMLLRVKTNVSDGRSYDRTVMLKRK